MSQILLPSSGILQINPNRLGVRQKRPFEDSLAIVQVSQDIGAYYRWFFEKQYGPCEFTRTLENNPVLIPPNHGCHISLSNRRTPLQCDVNYLRSINKKKVTFFYDPKVYRVWEFFAVRVYSKELDEICKNLGFKSDQLHITIGRLSLQALNTQDKLLLRTF